MRLVQKWRIYVSDARTKTFGTLKNWVLETAGVKLHFDLQGKQRLFWDELNTVEYNRGYTPGEYEKEGTPALHEMLLLTEAEYADYQARFTALC